MKDNQAILNVLNELLRSRDLTDWIVPQQQCQVTF